MIARLRCSPAMLSNTVRENEVGGTRVGATRGSARRAEEQWSVASPVLCPQVDHLTRSSSSSRARAVSPGQALEDVKARLAEYARKVGVPVAARAATPSGRAAEAGHGTKVRKALCAVVS